MEVKNQYIIQLLDNITNVHKEKALNNFVANYNAGKISLPVSYEQYLRLKDIQSRIKALGLDKDEMWFLLLFAKDLADRFIHYEREQLGMNKDYKQIEELFSKLEDGENTNIITNNLVMRKVIQCSSICNRLITKESNLTLKEHLISFCIYSFLNVKLLKSAGRSPNGKDTLNKSVLMLNILAKLFDFVERDKNTIRIYFSKNKEDIKNKLIEFLNISE